MASAASVGSGVRASLDPNLFTVSLTVREGASREHVEAALLAELERLTREPPSDEEMARALRQSEAQFAYGRDGVTSQAFALGYFQHLGLPDRSHQGARARRSRSRADRRSPGVLPRIRQ